jgi:hypothetical protein
VAFRVSARDRSLPVFSAQDGTPEIENGVSSVLSFIAEDGWVSLLSRAALRIEIP